MEFSLAFLIGCIIFLILLSAFFSGSETSLTSASKPRMHTLAKSGKKNAIIFEKLFRDKEKLICTILFANNLVNVLASALATKILIEITPAEGIIYATLIMTLMILIFGELLPKTIALSKADKIALKISPIFRLLIILLYPLTSALNSIVSIFLNVLGVTKPLNKEINEEREEELRGVIDIHGQQNESAKEEKNMLKSILDLDEITVGSIMIPRKEIFSLPSNISLDLLIKKVKDSPHSRIPIWEKNPENIIGVFHVRKLIDLQLNNNSNKFEIKIHCQKPWFIPESTKLDNQLMEFKKRKEHFSIVVDEYGEFLGIVTLEDIIEEIVGDIDDELDVKKPSSKFSDVKSINSNTFVVKGNTSIRDLNKDLNVNLPTNEASTIAGLIIYESRTIPKIGQIFAFYNIKFEVLSKKNNQITSLKITKKKAKNFIKKVV
ncbi:MAG: hypothetical protein CMM99_04610 [Rickettsiales bacterium]|nr:hypothetical protein [Rickettsiales bacterium]